METLTSALPHLQTLKYPVEGTWSKESMGAVCKNLPGIKSLTLRPWMDLLWQMTFEYSLEVLDKQCPVITTLGVPMSMIRQPPISCEPATFQAPILSSLSRVVVHLHDVELFQGTSHNINAMLIRLLRPQIDVEALFLTADGEIDRIVKERLAREINTGRGIALRLMELEKVAAAYKSEKDKDGEEKPGYRHLID